MRSIVRSAALSAALWLFQMSRSKPYQIVLSDRKPQVVPRYIFEDLLNLRLIEVSGEKRARPARDYHATLVDGEFRFVNRITGTTRSYYRSSWQIAESRAIYDERYIVNDFQRQRAIQDMCGPHSRKNEILIRRQFE